MPRSSPHPNRLNSRVGIPRLRPRMRGALQWLLACDSRFRMRMALARMDGRILRDIGLAEADARIEADKPFWKP